MARSRVESAEVRSAEGPEAEALPVLQPSVARLAPAATAPQRPTGPPPAEWAVGEQPVRRLPAPVRVQEEPGAALPESVPPRVRAPGGPPRQAQSPAAEHASAPAVAAEPRRAARLAPAPSAVVPPAVGAPVARSERLVRPRSSQTRRSRWRAARS
jgi:hypothetical protein